MHFFLSKSPSKRTPSMLPSRGPYGDSCLFTGPFFYISLKFLIKIPLNTEIFPFYQRSYKRSIPPCSPKVGPLWKQAPISQALFSVSFGVPSKGVLPPGFPHRAPSERGAPFLKPSYIPLSKSPVYEPPSSQQDPYGNRCSYPPGSPAKELLSRFPSQSSLRERERERETLHFQIPSFIHLSKPLVNKPPSRFPSGAPMNRDACLQSLPLHNLLDPQQMSPSSRFP